MKSGGRYRVPGGEGRLGNLLGITSKTELDQVENIALKQAEDALFRKLISRDRRFDAKDICRMHKVWLGKIYSWAGKYRTVDLTKGIRFAHARHIPNLMASFEKECLAKYTPCLFDSREDIVQALSVTHVELVLIHPFRDGNGRLARTLSTLMALQAGLPPLDFSPIEKGKGRQKYLRAIRLGWSKKDYEPIKEIFLEIIEKTLSRCPERGKSK